MKRGRGVGDDVFVAFLRSINVGSANRFKMADFKAALTRTEELQDVSTYLQSGNIVFRTDSDDSQAIIEKVLETEFNVDSPCVVCLSSKVLKSILDANPVPNAEPKQLHFGFMKDLKPETEVDLKAYPEPTQILPGVGIFINFENGVGKSKLTSKVLDAKFGQTVTLRNWNTVTNVHKLTNEIIL
jgi:uncharacterized protein (DUF1697 family)